MLPWHRCCITNHSCFYTHDVHEPCSLACRTGPQMAPTHTFLSLKGRNILKTKLSLRFTALSTLTILALAGCGSAGPADTTSAAAAPTGETITVTDPWVKAANTGMSAAFGNLTNKGEKDIAVTSVRTPASSALELHETVANESGQMVMREKTGGFTIPAHGSLDLEAGGNHIMLMNIVKPLKAGDDTTFTLTFSDKSTYEFNALVKEYSGAKENYEGSEDEGMDHEDMDMDHSATESAHDH